MKAQNLFRAARVSIFAASLVFCASVASAQSDTEDRSRKLFEDARALAGENRWSDACPLFQAAYELTPNGGTALGAADCYEKTDRPKQALELYKFIVSDPKASKNTERVEYVKGRIAEIESKLSPPPPPPSATSSASATPQTPAQEQEPKRVPNRVPAYAAFGVGGAGIVVGSIFGGLALSQANKVNESCSPDHICPKNLESEADSAVTKGWISNIAFGVGAAGVAVGIVFLVTGKPTMSSTVSANTKGLIVRF